MAKPPTRPDLKTAKLGLLGKFPEGLLWLGMPPDVAKKLAASLVEYAGKCKA